MEQLAKTAIVTGASRGIGRATAIQLGARGWQVFALDLAKDEQAEEVCSGIKAQGGQAQAFALDVSDRDAVGEFFKSQIKGKVFLDVLVNNAGITRDGLLLRMKADDWHKVMQVNLYGAFNCLQEASKIMVKQRQGKIINISSMVGMCGNPGQANYSSSKAGLIGLTKSAALELAPRNITVNAVAPGFISTQMTTGELDAQVQQNYLQRIPLGRFGEPQDVARTVAWLASDDASYITGQVIGVNGGLYL